MAVTAGADRRSAVIAAIATALLLAAMWIGAAVVSSLPGPAAAGDAHPSGPMLSPQRWESPREAQGLGVPMVDRAM